MISEINAKKIANYISVICSDYAIPNFDNVAQEIQDNGEFVLFSVNVARHIHLTDDVIKEINNKVNAYISNIHLNIKWMFIIQYKDVVIESIFSM